MSEYGSMTMARAATYDKERIRHALDGELMVGEDEHGFIYDAAPREECEAFILSVVDRWYHECNELAASGRAIERLLERHGFDVMGHFPEYVALHTEESGKCGGYLYESDIEELHDEAEGITSDGR